MWSFGVTTLKSGVFDGLCVTIFVRILWSSDVPVCDLLAGDAILFGFLKVHLVSIL